MNFEHGCRVQKCYTFKEIYLISQHFPKILHENTVIKDVSFSSIGFFFLILNFKDSTRRAEINEAPGDG